MPNQKQPLVLLGLWVISCYTWICDVEKGVLDDHSRETNRNCGLDLGWWKAQRQEKAWDSRGSSRLYSTVSFSEQWPLQLYNTGTLGIQGFPVLSSAFNLSRAEESTQMWPGAPNPPPLLLSFDSDLWKETCWTRGTHMMWRKLNKKESSS